MRRFSKGPNVLFEYRAGMDIADMGGVHARADATTCATYIDAQGVLRTAKANVVRDGHFIGDVRHLLLEKSSTNLVLQSENFGATWVPVGTPTRTAAAHTTAGVSLDLIGDDASGAAEGYAQIFTFTGNGIKAVSVFIRKNTATSSLIRLDDNTAGTQRLKAEITWVGNTPSVSASVGTYLGYEVLADNVYRLLFQTTSVTAANSNELYVFPATDNALTASPTGAVYLGGVQAENSVFPTSYVKTTTTTVTRAADALYFTHTPVPQTLTVYAKFVDPGARPHHVFSIGGSSAPHFRNYGATAEYHAHHHNGSGGSDASVVSADVFGTVVELVQELDGATGVTNLKQSVDGGSITSASGNDPAGTISGAWFQARLYVGTHGDGSATQEVTRIQVLRVLSGIQTFATMRHDFFDATVSESDEFVHLLEFVFSGGTVRLNTGVQDLSWNSQTWDAVGGLLEFSGIEENNDMRAQGVDVRLSGVEQTILSTLLNNAYRGRTVKIYRAHLDRTTGQVVGDPILLFQGLQLNPYNVEEERDRGGGTVRISTRITGYLGLSRLRGIQSNLPSHQHHFTGDTFFQHVAQLANRKIYWGTASPSQIGQRRGADSNKGPFK